MAVLFTAPFVTALNLSGLPIAGATLTFYATGTSTLAVVYANSALTTPLANPVASDAAGRFPAIYLGSATYRAVLRDASGVTIRDTDPINGSSSVTASVKDYGAVGDGVANDTAAINAAIAYVLSTTTGGTVFFPAGQYLVTEINATDLVGNFNIGLRLVGEGQFASKIKPYSGNTVLLNMMGRSNATVENLMLEAAAFQSQCGIFLSRSATSTTCNGNRFLNVLVFGNYSKACVVSLGAESSRWINCRRWNGNTGSTPAPNCTLWTGQDNTIIAVTPTNGGTPLAGPNTDNRQFGCEDYAPYSGAQPMVFSQSAGWAMFGHSIITGSGFGGRCVTYRDPIGGTNGVFNGPVVWTECHFETFGGNACHYLVGTGATAWNGINSIGGYYVVDDSVIALDYDRTSNVHQPSLQASRWTKPQVSPGLSVGPTIYAYALLDSDIDWRLVGGIGNVTVLGFATRHRISANVVTLAQHLAGDATVFAGALPTAGTFAVGQEVRNTVPVVASPKSWLCTVAGTAGTLTGITATTVAGSNAITVNSSTGMLAGQRIAIATATGGPWIVYKVAGTAVYLGAPVTNAVAAQAVSFSAATLTSTGNL